MSTLKLCFGFSLACHAIAFGLFGYRGPGLRPTNSPPEDSPLVMTLFVPPETPTSKLTANEVVLAPAPPAAAPTPRAKLPAAEALPVEEVAVPTLAVPEPTVVSPVAPPAAIVATVATLSNPNLPPVGDGIANLPLAGNNRAEAQPQLRARADYRRNPKPAYPPAARRRHQEGLVLLSVTVTAKGRASHVGVKRTSGFPLLDDAALVTVRDWEFEPARVGDFAMESEIEVPIRFQLRD